MLRGSITPLEVVNHREHVLWQVVRIVCAGLVFLEIANQRGDEEKDKGKTTKTRDRSASQGKEKAKVKEKQDADSKLGGDTYFQIEY